MVACDHANKNGRITHEILVEKFSRTFWCLVRWSSNEQHWQFFSKPIFVFRQSPVNFFAPIRWNEEVGHPLYGNLMYEARQHLGEYLVQFWVILCNFEEIAKFVDWFSFVYSKDNLVTAETVVRFKNCSGCVLWWEARSPRYQKRCLTSRINRNTAACLISIFDLPSVDEPYTVEYCGLAYSYIRIHDSTGAKKTVTSSVLEIAVDKV